MQDFILKYDTNKWVEKYPSPLDTLQLFITNKCNLRCKNCFYNHKLGNDQMPLQNYKSYVIKYLADIKKVILLGGEPTLHQDLLSMINFNNQMGIKTTIYSNGFNLKVLENINLDNIQIRIGVYGSYSGEKPLLKVEKTRLPLTIVYMLRRDNIGELLETAKMAEENFNCNGFYISSIRDIAITGDYWKDTSETIPVNEYAQIIQKFINDYSGSIKKIHIATRGIIITDKENFTQLHKCRFGNIFPDQEKIICPLDICKRILTKELIFNQRDCTKHHKCILQKIVLEHK